MTTATETIAQPETTQADDPFAAAMNAKVLPTERTFFGEIAVVDIWFCVLEKGVGKRLFDPSRDSIDRRRTAIKINLLPTRGEYEVKMDTIDTAPDWLKHTLPSLRQHQLDLRTLRGRWVQAKKVPTGETYQKGNETLDRTALVITAVYADKESCLAAADAFWASRKNGQAGVEEADIPAGQAAAPTTSAERDFAAQSLPLLWQSSGKSVSKFLDIIKSNPMIAAHFNESSPEVQHYTDGLPF